MSSDINNEELSYDDLTPVYKDISDGNYNRALLTLDTLSQQFQDNHNLYVIGGECYFNLQQYELAISCYDESIRIRPDIADTYNSKGNALLSLQKFDEAISIFKIAIKIKPDFDIAFFNIGICAMHIRSYELSIESFDMAIKLQPYVEKYKFAKSTLLLLYEDFKNGWVLYESRWKMDKLFSPKLQTTFPLWTGNKDAKLLVWPEQGIGDQIMHSALLRELKNKCSNLTVIVDPRLVELLTRSMGDICTFYPDSVNVNELDYDEHIAIGSLCQYLRSDEKYFENTRNGFLKDDITSTAQIKKNLHDLAIISSNKILGISWRSQNSDLGDHKSIRLKNLIESLNLEGYIFVSLQYGDTADEIKEVKNELGIDVITYEKVDNFNDIDGLVSLVQACDTVISIDNLTCQLAGALGKEIHILLTHGSVWLWGVNRSDSLWYSSVKIYRQEANENNWLGLFQRLKLNLNE